MLHTPTAVALMAILTATGCKQDSKPAPSQDKPATTAAPTPPPAPTPDAAAPAVAAGPTWQPYTSKEGGFSIEVPATPKESDQGGMKMVGAEFGTSAGDDRTAMCGAVYMKLPDGASADPKVMLDGATARHKQDAKVIEEKDVTIGKHPGRSLIVENSSHRKWMRVYIVDKTIYVLNCGGPFDRAAVDGPIATRFLDSFKLTN